MIVFPCKNCRILQSTVNVGLIVGASVSIVFLLIFIGIPLCVVVGVCCAASKTNRPARSRVVATTRRTGAGASTLVTSNQAGTSFTAPVQYPQQPVYKDAQFSCYNAPPSYSEATAFPLAAEVITAIIMILYTVHAYKGPKFLLLA
jgi:hypothetical protein